MPGARESRVFQCYADLEMTIFKFTKQMKAFVSISSSACLVLPIIYALYRLFVGEYTNKDWYLPYKVK